MKITIIIFVLLLSFGVASADMLNIVKNDLIPDSDYSCTLSVQMWEIAKPVWCASANPINLVSTDAKEILAFDSYTFVNMQARSDSGGSVGFFCVSEFDFASVDIVECHGKVDKNSVEMISLMLGGLFGISFVMAALWRF